MPVPVKPHGKLPWFFEASQSLADHVRGRRGSDREDSASIREDRWDYQDRLGSKASNQEAELDRVHVVMPRHPDREKVLRKL
jgi:AGZA family xanthine/uracil permease-like MFS transporter